MKQQGKQALSFYLLKDILRTIPVKAYILYILCFDVTVLLNPHPYKALIYYHRGAELKYNTLKSHILFPSWKYIFL